MPPLCTLAGTCPGEELAKEVGQEQAGQIFDQPLSLPPKPASSDFPWRRPEHGLWLLLSPLTGDHAPSLVTYVACLLHLIPSFKYLTCSKTVEGAALGFF